jgi:hypothetical protein
MRGNELTEPRRYVRLPTGDGEADRQHSWTRCTAGSRVSWNRCAVGSGLRGRTATLPTMLHLDVLAFAVGRGEVTLTVITLGQPFPAEREARLFSLLVSRAVAARHEYRAIGN